MSREIQIGVNPADIQAFSTAVRNNPNIDFASFNPHLALRCRIAGELLNGLEARVNASANGGPIDVRVNGSEVKDGGPISRIGLAAVIDVYSPGRGEKVADALLSKGGTLVIKFS